MTDRSRGSFALALRRAHLPACLALALLATLACSGGDPRAEIRAQQEAGRHRATIEPLRALLAEQPRDPELSFLYGRALVASGQPSLATWSLRQAMEDPEWRMKAGLQLAYAGLLTHDFNEVVHVTTELHEFDPADVWPLLYRAQAHAHWKKQPEAALEDAERVLEMDPDLLEAYEPKILALLALQRTDEAREALSVAGRRLVELDADESMLAWHCATTATMQQEAGALDEARATWADCLREHPAVPYVVKQAVGFYDALDEFERSLEVLETAHAAEPERRTFRVSLAERLLGQGKAAEGEALLREATQAEDPLLAAGAWSDMATYQHALGEHSAAADSLARAIELVADVHGSIPQLQFQYADALLMGGRLEEAARAAAELEVAAQRELILGRIAQERGRPEEALAHFDEALRLWPDNPFARYYAALAAEGVGDFERALEEYRYSIRVQVGATDARTRAAKLLIAQGQPLIAYQILFVDVANMPLEPEGQMLSFYLMARVANPRQVQQALVELAQRDRARLGEALSRAARGAAETAGPGGALDLIEGAPGLDLASPRDFEALRTWVELGHQAGQGPRVGETVEAAVAEEPGFAGFHEVLGLHRELSGDRAGAETAYRRAVELEPRNVGALEGLGRLALPVDPAVAARAFERALRVEPESLDATLGLSAALQARGQPEAAAERLDEGLELHPWSAPLAIARAELDLERGIASEGTLERARRAVHVGGGLQALELVGRVHAERGEDEEAERVAQRVAAVREAMAEARGRADGTDGSGPAGEPESGEPSGG